MCVLNLTTFGCPPVKTTQEKEKEMQEKGGGQKQGRYSG